MQGNETITEKEKKKLICLIKKKSGFEVNSRTLLEKNSRTIF